MDKIIKIAGQAIPLAMNDVDTDLIIPAQFLTSTSSEGYGENLFRRLKDEDPDFVFNQSKYKNANILIAKNNFGCGSSREHAVWALKQAGIAAIIATDFADIFANNSAKNGLVLIAQPLAIVEQLLTAAEQNELQLSIDLDSQQLTFKNDNYDFSLNPFHRYCFMNGLDELDYLLEHMPDIDQYRASSRNYNFLELSND